MVFQLLIIFAVSSIYFAMTNVLIASNIESVVFVFNCTHKMFFTRCKHTIAHFQNKKEAVKEQAEEMRIYFVRKFSVTQNNDEILRIQWVYSQCKMLDRRLKCEKVVSTVPISFVCMFMTGCTLPICVSMRFSSFHCTSTANHANDDFLSKIYR